MLRLLRSPRLLIVPGRHVSRDRRSNVRHCSLAPGGILSGRRVTFSFCDRVSTRSSGSLQIFQGTVEVCFKYDGKVSRSTLRLVRRSIGHAECVATLSSDSSLWDWLQSG
jgi:hypothetical protein